MKAHINTLIEKYWAGESTLAEEARLKAYFASDQTAPEHQEMKNLFSFMDNQYSVAYPGNLDVTKITQTSLGHMDQLVENYLDGTSTQEEEKQLQQYLSSDKVAPKHLELQNIFSFTQSQSQVAFPGVLDMDLITSGTLSPVESLVEKYLDGESSLEEEAELRKYLSSSDVAPAHAELATMFSFYKEQGAIAYQGEVDTSFVRETTTKTRTLTPATETRTLTPAAKRRSLIPRMVGIAATLGLLLMFSVNFLKTGTDHSYHKQYTEIEDPEEALEVTKNALAFLGKKYESGTKSMKYIKELERTSVFNFKN